MTKYLVKYTIPEKKRKLVVVDASPEVAALKARRELGDEIEDISVTDLEDDDADEKQVYEWCFVCKLPIWLTQEQDTYRALRNGVFAHTTCVQADEDHHP